MRRLTLILCAATLLLPSFSHAEDLCDGSLVATASLGDESGIGGTGNTGESGIGGTGNTGESGIGGTGFQIYGTLNAFGSLCINGFRVLHDAEAAIRIEGRATASAEDLAIGQVLFVQAEAFGSEYRAKRIQIVKAVTGTIDAIDREQHTLSVFGRQIQVAESATYGSGLKITLGKSVTVYGLWQDDAHIVATRIVAAPDEPPGSGTRLAELLRRAPESASLSIEGYVTHRPGPAIVRVEGLELELPDAPEIQRPIQSGERIRAVGDLTRRGILRVRPARPPTRTDLERPATRERPERPVVIERPERIEKAPIVDRIEAPPRIDSVR